MPETTPVTATAPVVEPVIAPVVTEPMTQEAVQSQFEKEFLDANDIKADVPAPVTPAPSDGNAPETVPPSVVQPDVPAAKTGDEKPVADTPDKPSPDEEAEILERAGLKKQEPETVATLTTKLGASSTEGKRLADELRTRDEWLAGLGLEISADATGKLGFKATDDYKANLDDKEIPDVFTNLTDKEKELAVEDPPAFAKLIAKQTSIALLEKRPPVGIPRGTVKPATQDQIETARQDLQKAVLADGKTLRYEGSKEMDQMMLDILIASPQWVQDGFNQDPKTGMQMLHAIAYRAYAPVMARKAQAALSAKGKTPPVHPPIASDSASVGRQLGNAKEMSDADYAKAIAESDRR
ncbi:MAG: hypothetical protein Q7J98_05120 [Kiritimatiellia bacterium]|nr:hypothetical protein [Kiritimatiellia bacterium]